MWKFRKEIVADFLLFLYRDIGLFWEIVLSKRNDITSLQKNKELAKFIKEHRIIYNTTNAITIGEKSNSIEENTFYYTDTGPNVIGGLVKHLRNSIMHCRFEVSGVGQKSEIYFEDYWRKKQTMAGKIDKTLLKDFMGVLHRAA